MVFDYTQTVLVETMMIYPDFVYNAQPKPPSQIKETVYIRGSNITGQSSVTGSADT